MLCDAVRCNATTTYCGDWIMCCYAVFIGAQLVRWCGLVGWFHCLVHCWLIIIDSMDMVVKSLMTDDMG